MLIFYHTDLKLDSLICKNKVFILIELYLLFFSNNGILVLFLENPFQRKPMSIMEKKFIENLFNEKAKNDSNSEDLANTLNILSKTVFGDVNRFVFELLQNADDSPNIDNSLTLDVGFHLFDRHLLFYHNGTHFSELDIKSISKVGSLDSQKDKRSDKTGY